MLPPRQAKGRHSRNSDRRWLPRDSPGCVTLRTEPGGRRSLAFNQPLLRRLKFFFSNRAGVTCLLQVGQLLPQRDLVLVRQAVTEGEDTAVQKKGTGEGGCEEKNVFCFYAGHRPRT